MKNFVLLSALFVASINSYAGIKKMISCRNGIEITVTSKKKISLFESPEYRKRECGIGVYTGCAKYVNCKKGKISVCFTFSDTICNPFVTIDSCFQTLTIDNIPVKLCRLKVYGHETLIAQIAILDHVMDMTFKKEDYDFAMELLSGMKIAIKAVEIQ